MNTTDANFNPTPGPWSTNGAEIVGADGLTSIADVPKWGRGTPFNSVTESNATLIAEAGTVYHETGKTPARLEADNNYPILWQVSHGLKRECVANGTL